MGRLKLAVATAMFGLVSLGSSCNRDDGDDDDNDGGGDESLVGLFEGLFDDVAVGFNYAYDIAIVPGGVDGVGIVSGDILVANYGTSEVLRVPNPTLAEDAVSPEAFFDGADVGLTGTIGISVPADGTVWVAFEGGGDGDQGGIAVLSPTAEVLEIIDGAVAPGAFSNPGGLCYSAPPLENDGRELFFLVNKGDGTLWSISAANTAGEDAQLVRLGSGLATGPAGQPGTAPDGVTNKKDLPEGGARGCVYIDGRVYVADAQNAQVVRFDDADTGEDVDGVPLEETPAELVTHPTAVSTNYDGDLIVMSSDNAHAFVALLTPTGAFQDNGLHDLNVNSGNFAAQVADGNIWFTRANNTNGSLRAITPDMDTPPSSEGIFPPQ